MRLFILLLSFLFLSACSPLANIDYDKSINFKAYDSYNIQQKPIRVVDDSRVNTSFMQQRIVSAINLELSMRGFQKNNNNAKFKVIYALDIKSYTEYDDSGVYIGLGTHGHHSVFGLGFTIPLGNGDTYRVDKLVLTIDMISNKTNKLMWRGSYSYRLFDGSTEETNTQMISNLVTEILENFPPKSKNLSLLNTTF